ncbi:MAG: family 10 glycosylhydrolase [Candidatus Fermentibacteraceae bacterium]|nr:family 10 glycosylhydrolase [Candidatus Fermentibacteraceae bacterium]
MLPVIQILLAMHGIWSAWGYNAGNWNELAPLLSENGYDTVFYCAAYGLETDIEGLRECCEACRDYDIDVHAWVVMWKISKSPDSLKNCFEEHNRLQVSLTEGEEASNWLCPSDPENVELFASLCANLARSAPVSGIHLDYIRYADDRVCFCDGCRSRFSRWSGNYRFAWPDDCARGGILHDEYNRWRSRTITSAVQAVRDSLGRLDRFVMLSAAVLPRQREMDYFGQHWENWISDGLLDFVVPMNYTMSDSELIAWSEPQIELAGEVPVYCGLINYSDDYHCSLSEIAGQRELAENLGFDGWVLFHLSSHYVDMLRIR